MKTIDATDLVGRTFGLLTVETLQPRPRRNTKRKYVYRYNCRCACGKLHTDVIRIDLSSKRRSTCTGSLDRIDSSRGYVPGNVQWVHKDVNQIKWDLTNARFVKICRAVAAHARFK